MINIAAYNEGTSNHGVNITIYYKCFTIHVAIIVAYFKFVSMHSMPVVTIMTRNMFGNAKRKYCGLQ